MSTVDTPTSQLTWTPVSSEKLPSELEVIKPYFKCTAGGVYIKMKIKRIGSKLANRL